MGETAGRNFALVTAAKSTQTETWLLLTAYRNLSSHYPMVPLPTTYNVQCSHNTCITDNRQQQKTHRAIKDSSEQLAKNYTCRDNVSAQSFNFSFKDLRCRHCGSKLGHRCPLSNQISLQNIRSFGRFRRQCPSAHLLSAPVAVKDNGLAKFNSEQHTALCVANKTSE